MDRRVTALTFLTVCCALAGVDAQVVTITRAAPAAPAPLRLETLSALGYVQDADFVVVPDGAAPAQGGAQPAKGAPSARLEKLKTLEYDRRPSTILKAWANPPKPPAPEAPAEPAAPEAREDVAPGAPEDGAPQAPAVPAQPADAQAATPPEGQTPEEAQQAAEAAEAARKQAAEAALAKKKAEEEAARKKAEAEAIAAEMSALQRAVTLGDWAAVRTYLAGLAPDDWKGGYARLLQSLQQGPQNRPPDVHPMGQQFLEKNRFSPDDVLGLAAAGPKPLAKENLTLLGQILRQALDQGHRLERFLDQLRPALDAPDAPIERRALALVLVAANEPLYLEGLIPSAEEAEAAGDREGLNLVSRLCLAKSAQDGKVAWLEQAWRATLAALAAGDVDEATKDEAIQRAVDIAPRLRVELGQAWLDESFTSRPERGMEIVAAIGTASSTALQKTPQDQDRRLKLLELQTTAAKALLTAAPERADAWAAELSLLAGNWMREALWTYQNDESTSLGPRMQRDAFGNIYWFDNGFGRRGGVQAIPTGKILEIRPGDAWLARVDATLRPRIHAVTAQLLLKVSEEAKAFPHIEELAATHPREAKELVAEFLRVWARNHDPNSDQNRANQFVYVYGFDDRAAGIPLTRSQQERNLKELAGWVAKLRTLPVEVPDELVANAFTAAHSQAEIYRLETIESVFGPLDGLEPKTLATLLQRMRANLVTVWRDPAVQEKQKTKRNQKDLEAEVVRGYELARATVERALESHPDSWQLVLAAAALQHDQNDWQHELKKDAEFSARRAAAFETFARAADLYARSVEALEKDEETTQAYETWFYAALGACDLRAVDFKRLLAAEQIGRIRAALQALPGERAQRHMDLFANAFVTRLGSVNPSVKQRYVREGLEITGDIDLVRDARKVYEYYADLVGEIQLRVTPDGSDRVGNGAPFGLKVDLRHTRDIERESGGFGKYLQNQNSQAFSYNYGRPTEDYRDKFEEAARAALAEHFEVLSVTFNEPDVRSRADPEYGWRVTPYAYLLVKPRGPQVDRVPSLSIDLDFLDTTGYVILPIESPVVPIDASAPVGDERPWSGLALTQMLDERQAKSGKLILEVKATATGLVPALESLVDVRPEGFQVASVEDSGVAVTKFSEEEAGVLTERTWTLTLRAAEGLSELPTSFTFAEPKVEVASNERYRYVDADLAAVEPTVALERRYGEPSRAWMLWLGALAVLAAAGIWLWRRARPAQAAEAARWRVPEAVTPFTVLGLLREIERNDGLAPDAKRELATQIADLERHFFGEEDGQAPDLRGIAESWTVRAR